MRIVVANLSAVYTGRGETVLPPYNRILIVKNDGSVSIHSEKGFKPMNYMTAKNELESSFNEQNELVWLFQGKKQESLTVTFHEIHDEVDLDLGNDDPGFSSKAGQESQLQEWLSKRLNEIDGNLRFISREYQTGAGPVDLLAEGADGSYVVVEVKRVAAINTVGQVLRYVDAMREKHPDRRIDGVIAAVEFKETTLTIAEKKGVRCLTVPADWLTVDENDTGSVLENAIAHKVNAAANALFD